MTNVLDFIPKPQGKPDKGKYLSLKKQLSPRDVALLAKLDERLIELHNPPPKPVPVFTLKGQSIATAGNLTVIAAQAKAGKSTVVGALIASVLHADNPTEKAPDCFGFAARPSGGKAVVLFDTEQSHYDSWLLMFRAFKRAGLDTQPDNLRTYRLLDVSTAERRKMLLLEMERSCADCNGLLAMIVDGVGDLSIDPNDPKEAFGLVEELVRLAVKYDCPIILILHENPSTTGGAKTRGHLGSQLERKAESNVRLSKVGDITTISAEQCRSAFIGKDKGSKFKFCQELHTHVSVTAATAEEIRTAERQKAEPLLRGIFGLDGSLSYTELMQAIMRGEAVKNRTAQRRIKEWTDKQWIKQSSQGYELC